MAIKDFFHSIGDSVQRAGNALDRTVEIQKLNYRISQKREEIEKIYSALGKTVAEYAAKGADYSAELERALAAIAELNSEIEGLEQERTARTGLCRCPGCGKDSSPLNTFCPHCGIRMSAEEPSASDKSEEEPGAPEQ